MASLEERFQKGIEIRARLAGGEGRLFKGSVPVAYELAPDMYRITTECLYGSIWSRPGLDIRYRAMATQGDRILNFQQSQQGAALVDDSRADNEIPLKPPIYVVTGD